MQLRIVYYTIRYMRALKKLTA